MDAYGSGMKPIGVIPSVNAAHKNLEYAPDRVSDAKRVFN